jgi:enoyl-CoA hydratase
MSVHHELESGVGILRLDAPRRAHAYDAADLAAFEAGLDALLAAGAAVIVVESAGEGAFCGGADLRGLASPDPLSALDLDSQRVFERLARAPAISIAAVQGPAVAGGCELALACDLRVVGPKARFALPETSLGLLPAAGGTSRLSALLGGSIARQVILAGREIHADQALAWGLAIELHEDPRAAARTLARAVQARDPLANRLAKELLAGPGLHGPLLAERLAEAVLYGQRRRG